jgi:hypothetical protein
MLLFKMERGLLPEYLCYNLNQVHNMHTHTTLEERLLKTRSFIRACNYTTISEEMRSFKKLGHLAKLGESFVRTLI